MKPTKNQIYCIDCGKTKMLFASEKKALNFIRFNADTIFEETGKRPVRAYYCPLCCGWHVTSREEFAEGYHSRRERLVNRYLEKRRAEGKLLCDNLEAKAKSREERRIEARHQEEIRKVYEEAESILNLVEDRLGKGSCDCAKEALSVISGMMESYRTVEFLRTKRIRIINRVRLLGLLAENAAA